MNSELFKELYEQFGAVISKENPFDFFDWATGNLCECDENTIRRLMNGDLSLQGQDNSDYAAIIAPQRKLKLPLFVSFSKDESKKICKLYEKYNEYWQEQTKSPDEQFLALIRLSLCEGIFRRNSFSFRKRSECWIDRQELKNDFNRLFKKTNKIWIHSLPGSGCSSFITDFYKDQARPSVAIVSYETTLNITLSKVFEGTNPIAIEGMTRNDLKDPIFRDSTLIIDEVPNDISDEEVEELSHYAVRVILITSQHVKHSSFEEFTFPDHLEPSEIEEIYIKYFGNEPDRDTFNLIRNATNSNLYFVSLLFRAIKQKLKPTDETDCINPDDFKKAFAYFTDNGRFLYAPGLKKDLFKIQYNRQSQSFPGHLATALYRWIQLLSLTEEELHFLRLLASFGHGFIRSEFIDKIITVERDISTICEKLSPLSITYDKETGDIYVHPLVAYALRTKKTLRYAEFKKETGQITSYIDESTTELNHLYMGEKFVIYAQTLNESVQRISNRGKRLVHSASIDDTNWRTFLYSAYRYYHVLNSPENANEITKLITYPEKIKHSGYSADKDIFDLQSLLQEGKREDYLSGLNLAISEVKQANLCFLIEDYLDMTIQRHFKQAMILPPSIASINAAISSCMDFNKSLGLYKEFAKENGWSQYAAHSEYYSFAENVLFKGKEPFSALNDFKLELKNNIDMSSARALAIIVTLICCRKGILSPKSILNHESDCFSQMEQFKKEISGYKLMPTRLLKLTLLAYTQFRALYTALPVTEECLISNADYDTLLGKTALTKEELEQAKKTCATLN